MASGLSGCVHSLVAVDEPGCDLDVLDGHISLGRLCNVFCV